jgi:hypothetical protein
MKSILTFTVIFGVLASFAPSWGADSGNAKKVVPWIGIVEVASGQAFDLAKLKTLASKSKFDWGNVVSCKIFNGRAIFIIDSNGSPISFEPEYPFKQLGNLKPSQLPPVAHFELILRGYSSSVQLLKYASGFEPLQTDGITLTRLGSKEQETGKDK